MDSKDTGSDLRASLHGETATTVSPAPLSLDAGDYMGDLDGLDMTEAQKVELLETLWSIMGVFARMGFEVDVWGLIFREFNEASAPESGDGRLTASTNMETPSKGRGEEGIA